MFSIFQAVVDTFEKLVAILKKSPLASFFAVLMMISLYFAYETSQSINRISEDPQTNQQHFESAVSIAEEVNTSISNLRQNTNASHVLVRQFHNGKQDLTGLPFTYISTTYASLDSGLGLDDNAFDSIPLSTMNLSLAKMWQDYDNPICIRGLTRENPDPIFRSFLEKYRMQRYIICPMTNLLKYPIGVVMIGFSDEDQSGDIKNITHTKEVSDRITGYLVSIREDEKRGFFDWLAGIIL